MTLVKQKTYWETGKEMFSHVIFMFLALYLRYSLVVFIKDFFFFVNGMSGYFSVVISLKFLVCYLIYSSLRVETVFIV